MPWLYLSANFSIISNFLPGSINQQFEIAPTKSRHRKLLLRVMPAFLLHALVKNIAAIYSATAFIKTGGTPFPIRAQRGTINLDSEIGLVHTAEPIGWRRPIGRDFGPALCTCQPREKCTRRTRKVLFQYFPGAFFSGLLRALLPLISESKALLKWKMANGRLPLERMRGVNSLDMHLG